jgi:hypothetical protein
MSGEDRFTDPMFERIDTRFQVDGARRARTGMLDCGLELNPLPLNTLHVLLHRLPGVGVGHLEIRWFGHDDPSLNEKGT